MSIVYGKPIRIVEKDVLDTFGESWTTKTVADAANPYKAYAMDPVDPLAFWLFPLAIDGRDVVVTYAAIPPDVTDTTDLLSLNDMYISDIVDYVVYRALSKDSRGGAPGVAEKYRDKFLLSLGANRQVLRNIGQNTTRPPDAEA
jgi:hypothetical protein